MIRHVVLFRLNDGLALDDPRVVEAERVASQVGEKVPVLKEWRAGRNIARRPDAYDFAVIGLVADEEALAHYMDDPFHRHAISLWREISTWIVADLEE